MTKTLYVGNLPWSTTEEQLEALFSNYVGVLSCRIITDRQTGRSRGFGFVEVSDGEAERAIELLNGRKIGNREIVVNEAKPRQGR